MTQTRRRWTINEKRSIVAETDKEGVSKVARRYGIAPRLLFTWRSEFAGQLGLMQQPGRKVAPISEVKALEHVIEQLEKALAERDAEVEKLKRELSSLRAKPERS